MHSTAEINAIIRNAKQQRAEYIGAKLQKATLPVALVALVSLGLVQLAGGPSQDQAQQHPVTDVNAQNG